MENVLCFILERIKLKYGKNTSQSESRKLPSVLQHLRCSANTVQNLPPQHKISLPLKDTKPNYLPQNFQFKPKGQNHHDTVLSTFRE